MIPEEIIQDLERHGAVFLIRADRLEMRWPLGYQLPKKFVIDELLRQEATAIYFLRQREIVRGKRMDRLEKVRTHWLIVAEAQNRIRAAILNLDEHLRLLEIENPGLHHELTKAWPQRLVDATVNRMGVDDFQKLADEWVREYAKATVERVHGKSRSR